MVSAEKTAKGSTVQEHWQLKKCPKTWETPKLRLLPAKPARMRKGPAGASAWSFLHCVHPSPTEAVSELQPPDILTLANPRKILESKQKIK